MAFPKKVKIVEVGPRDGLQNEPGIVPTPLKIEFINRLSETGLSYIEATSFVSAKWIPQLADHRDVYSFIIKKPNITYSALVPNVKGLEAAISVGVKEIAVFTAASEAFSKSNTNSTIAESLERAEKVISYAKSHDVKVRGYVSCALGAPHGEVITPVQVRPIVHELLEMGCYEISLGDTIGVGTPLASKRLIDEICKSTPVEKIGVHFHDTYGQALANIYAVLEQGVSSIDSSIGGLGGCPYAKGASGNVATEEVVYMLDGLGIETGVNLDILCNLAPFITTELGIKVVSKVSKAYCPT